MLRILFLCLMLANLANCKTIPEPNDPAGISVGHSEFVFMGDTGTGESGQYEVAHGIEKFCLSNECNFGLLLGDNIYSSGVKSVDDPQWQTKFEEPYKNLRFKFYAALGNHDHYGNWEAEVNYHSAKWSMPTRYYLLYSEYASIYVLDTEKITDAQIAWLDQALAMNIKPWTIVIGHHPAYSSGSHGDTSEVKRKILPIMQKYNVDFFLSGHDHDQEIIERDEMNFIISGAGAKLRDIDSGRYTLWSKSALGFSHMSITKNKCRLRMLDSNGNVLFEKKYSK